MKKLLLASAAMLAVGIATASAADIQRRAAMPAKAPVYVAPFYNWTDFYVGINGGGGWAHSDFSAPLTTGTFSPSGGIAGGTVGYNWQMNQIVFGVEGDIDWSNIRGSVACPGGICETRNNWLGTARGRLGYAFDRVMPYVTGGAAFGDIKTNTPFGSSSSTKAGWTVGGGVEAAIAGPWTAKAEYLYVDLGNGGSVLGSNASFHSHILRAGLNYRF